MSSRWAIRCCPFDRTTSTSEDGEVICNEKKSQEYRRTAQIPESRIIVCPFVKRSAEDRLRATMNLLASEIVIVDREEKEGGWKCRPVLRVRTIPPRILVKNHLHEIIGYCWRMTFNGPCSDGKRLSSFIVAYLPWVFEHYRRPIN